MKTTNYIKFEELEDKYIGKIGTPEREQYEFDLQMEIIGERIKEDTWYKLENGNFVAVKI